MFNSLFSDRYNKKRSMFYEQYKATRRRYPNLPIYKRAKEPMQLPSKFVKRTQRKFKQHDFDYEDWITSNFVSIVVRRNLEQRSAQKLMPRISADCQENCSWRCWPQDDDEQQLEDLEPRRSQRLNLKFKEIYEPWQLHTNDAINWQQPLTTTNAKATSWPTLVPEIRCETPTGEQLEQLQQLNFINDSSRHESLLYCNMCGSRFEKSCQLELHTLEECRKYLLATLLLK
ncbi:uncharacterized protein LOC108603024 isoform X2 [Drosophila busckii]|uniref:uncharacterized protein LOC108603024 isoform X2 n=1 Tax=Drosophila busckii TaxID=30019 RepID=UPI00083ECF93|nr:uncharacterized protein LOC108603024 isoform X2 [Drosophila busckii]